MYRKYLEHLEVLEHFRRSENEEKNENKRNILELSRHYDVWSHCDVLCWNKWKLKILGRKIFGEAFQTRPTRFNCKKKLEFYRGKNEALSEVIVWRIISVDIVDISLSTLPKWLYVLSCFTCSKNQTKMSK